MISYTILTKRGSRETDFFAIPIPSNGMSFEESQDFWEKIGDRYDDKYHIAKTENDIQVDLKSAISAKFNIDKDSIKIGHII